MSSVKTALLDGSVAHALAKQLLERVDRDASEREKRLEEKTLARVLRELDRTKNLENKIDDLKACIQKRPMIEDEVSSRPKKARGQSPARSNTHGPKTPTAQVHREERGEGSNALSCPPYSTHGPKAPAAREHREVQGEGPVALFCPPCDSTTHGWDQCTAYGCQEAVEARLMELRLCPSCTLSTHKGRQVCRRMTCEHCSKKGHHGCVCNAYWRERMELYRI